MYFNPQWPLYYKGTPNSVANKINFTRDICDIQSHTCFSPLIPAEELGIKSTVPAYLNSNLTKDDLATGVSFASGGAGYDPLTSKIVVRTYTSRSTVYIRVGTAEFSEYREPMLFSSIFAKLIVSTCTLVFFPPLVNVNLVKSVQSVISLSDQLALFKEYIGKLKAAVGEDKANTVIAKSLYLVVAGSDDIANTYFVARVRKLQYDVPGYTSLMVDCASGFLKVKRTITG